MPQRQRSQPPGYALPVTSGCVAPQSQSASAMLLRHALPADRQRVARSFRIYEMG